MKLLFDSFDSYLARVKWWDFALLKFCLAAMGFMAGLFVPKEKRRPFFLLASIIFVLTHVPLMAKYLSPVEDYISFGHED